jgi:hypothetical protein
MSVKDKLEIGLKPDAPYRRDNLPDFQRDDPSCKLAAAPGDSAALRRQRERCESAPLEERRRGSDRRTADRRKIQRTA